MSVIDHSPIFAPFFKSQKYSRVIDVGVTKNFYVSTTGSDANNGESVGSPFLTIQKAINVAGSTIHGGEVIINIADGTYNENLLAKDLIGSKGDVVRGNSVVTLLGNTALPSNVIIIGDNTTLGTFKQINTSTVYILDGLDIRSNSATSSAAIHVDHSVLYIRALNVSAAGFAVFARNAAHVEVENVATGGTYAVTSNGFTALECSLINIRKNLTITGFISICLSAGINSLINYLPPAGSTSTFTADPATKAFVCFQASQFSVISCAVTGAGVINIMDITRSANSDVIRLINNGQAFFNGGGTSTVNITNASHTATIAENSYYTEANSFTWVHAGYSPNYRIDPGSMDEGINAFSGATLSGFEFATANKYGSDFRYTNPVRGTHTGVLPLGVTVFMTNDQSQSVYYPLYIAQQDEMIDKLEVSMGTGNGAAHTDTFTVVKNAVDTTMTLAITNAATGSTLVNPVTLAAGDTVGIKIATDAATLGANVNTQLAIRKI